MLKKLEEKREISKWKILKDPDWTFRDVSYDENTGDEVITRSGNGKEEINKLEYRAVSKKTGRGEKMNRA